ncbi:DUF4440 domain-containing protein [Alphaproteobacteria bacterium]|nr:DUF4440 domain-containing protein [Alphaproteobacteria bacterium]
MTKPENVLEAWVELLNTGDIEGLLNLYDRKAILIPTFSDSIFNTPFKLGEYFRTLGSRKGLNVSLQKQTLIVQDLQKDIFSLSGIYSWSFYIDGKLKSFDARFSYLIDVSKANPILQHHSSQTPQKL